MKISRKTISWTFFNRAIGAVLQFLFTLYVARVLGAEYSGIFFLLSTLLIGFSVLGKFGLDIGLSRILSQFAGNNGKNLKAVYLSVIKICLITSGFLTFCGLIFSKEISEFFFNNGNSTLSVQLTFLTIIPFCLIWVHSCFFKCIGMPSLSGFIEITAIPFLTIVISFFIGIFQSLTVELLALSFLISNILVLVLAITVSLRRVKTNNDITLVEVEFNKILEIVLPLILASILDFLLTWLTAFILSYFHSEDKVGIYNVAFRVGRIITFFLVIVSSLYMGRLTKLVTENDLVSLKYEARKISNILFITCLPALIGIYLFSFNILKLFGEEFVEGNLCLKLIATGQFFNVSTGMASTLLILTGNGKYLMYNSLYIAIFVLISSLIILPNSSVLGAGLISAIALISINIANCFSLYKRTNILSVPYFNIFKK